MRRAGLSRIWLISPEWVDVVEEAHDPPKDAALGLPTHLDRQHWKIDQLINGQSNQTLAVLLLYLHSHNI